jgi:hypothetical protein
MVVALAKFDEQIARYKAHLELAKEDLADLDAGRTHYINDVDQGPELRKRAESNLDLFSRLIAAYEKKNS